MTQGDEVLGEIESPLKNQIQVRVLLEESFLIERQAVSSTEALKCQFR